MEELSFSATAATLGVNPEPCPVPLRVELDLTASPLFPLFLVYLMQIWVQPEHLTRQLASVFCQLTFVHMAEIPEGYDLSWSLFILEAAPFLKELYMTVCSYLDISFSHMGLIFIISRISHQVHMSDLLTVYFYLCPIADMQVWDHVCLTETDEEKRKELSYSENKGVEWDSAAAGFQHRSLATLVIVGFESEDCFVSYIRRVMVAAVNLADMFLCLRGKGRFLLLKEANQPEPSLQCHAYSSPAIPQYGGGWVLLPYFARAWLTLFCERLIKVIEICLASASFILLISSTSIRCLEGSNGPFSKRSAYSLLSHYPSQ